MINDNDKIKMFEMRVRGCTLEEIGRTYSITRERVRQILKSATSRSTSLIRGRDGIIYPNISNWLRDNDYSIGEFAVMLGYKLGGNRSATRLSHLLKDRHTQGFRMPQILKILEVTGMTFEEAFKLEEDNKNLNQ
jgi:hypothetical protein